MDIRAQVAVAATPQAVWIVVGEQFGLIGEWASAIFASTIDGPPAVGSTRYCETAGFGPVAAGVIHEQLTTFDAGQMTFVYRAIDGLPAFVSSAVNRWRVTQNPGGASVLRIVQLGGVSPVGGCRRSQQSTAELIWLT